MRNGSRKRPMIIGVRLSPDEMTVLSAAARDAGKTVAAFLRDCALAKASPLPRSAKCPFCGDVLPLNRDGRLRMHSSAVTNWQIGWGNCRGAHEFPAMASSA